MAMTASVKDELSRVDVPKPCCRRAEMAALLRFAGGLHIVSGRVVVEAELDTGAVARRLRREVAEVYGYSSEIHVLASGGLRKGSHYIVRVVKDGEALARQTGLLDVRGRPVRGLPAHVVAAGVCCAVAAGRVPGPRLADRAGPLVRAGDHLPGSGVGAGAGRRGPADRDQCQGARGARGGPGGGQGR
jgi:DNA-binding transcriptional regulator WhiA